MNFVEDHVASNLISLQLNKDSNVNMNFVEDHVASNLISLQLNKDSNVNIWS